MAAVTRGQLDAVKLLVKYGEKSLNRSVIIGEFLSPSNHHIITTLSPHFITGTKLSTVTTRYHLSNIINPSIYFFILCIRDCNVVLNQSDHNNRIPPLS
jgi:hypothetical protein